MIFQPLRRLLACSGALLLAGGAPAHAAEPEAAVLARTSGPDVVRLKADGRALRGILRRALDFGSVTAQTGNALVAIERSGVATRMETAGEAPVPDADSAAGGDAGDDAGPNAGGQVGGYIGGDIDLRFNFNAWRYAFAVTQPADGGTVSRSLRFYDAQGNAVHKLTLRNEAAGGLFEKLAQDFRLPDQHAPLDLGVAPPQPEKPDSAVNAGQLRHAWLTMEHPAQFSAILAEFGVGREQALRLAPPGMAQQLAPHALCLLLAEAARHRLSVMALVGNAGVTQIYTGKVGDATGDGVACTAQAPGVSLRLRGGLSQRAYVVRRAGVTSVELFGPDGEPALTLFNLPERVQPPPPAWEALIRSLPGQPPARP